MMAIGLRRSLLPAGVAPLRRRGTLDKFPGERRRGDRMLESVGAAGLRAISFPRQIESPPAHLLVTTIVHFRSYYESIRNTGHDTPCPVVSREQK
jgi:hypothetical protein